MQDWKTVLMAVDDDYLIGMANKGLVKRAYKDMEAGDYKVLSAGDEAQVSVGGEAVVVHWPLAESTCSCPSRTICRHVLLGILALREYVGGETSADGVENMEANLDLGEAGAFGAGQNLEDTPITGVIPNLEKAKITGVGQNSEKAKIAGTNPESAEGQTEEEKGAKPTEKEFAGNEIREAGKIAEAEAKEISKKEKNPAEEKENGKSDLKSHLLEEIAAYPLPAIKKLLGTKQLLEIARQMQVGQLPEITYSGVATVKLPKGGYSVKLLSPLEYSTCSCHKKELCAHKAAALLWCKLTTGQIKAEDLKAEEEGQEYDFGQVREAASQMKVFLQELLDTGLARISPDVLDYLDRLAIISHNAKLANFEGYWRALHDSYENYLKRKASFHAEKLMEQFARLYQRVELLGKTEDAVQVAVLGGEFRSEYLPAGNLDLAGIVMEHFESAIGYEGETVYFLEENTKEWYTYTVARPVFYESNGRKRRQEKAAAPWELPVSFEEMVGLRIHLSGARSDMRGRLSASAQTKGEVMGSCKKGKCEQGNGGQGDDGQEKCQQGNPQQKNCEQEKRQQKKRQQENGVQGICLHTGDMGGWYYRDFGKLFAQQVDTKRTLWLKEKGEERRDGELVFLRPYSFTKGEFSKTEQKLLMWLYDATGREVIVELAYSKREEWGIGYLERLTEEKEPCFLGKLYFKDGRMRLYPVTVFEKGEWVEDLSDGEEDNNMQIDCEETGFDEETPMEVLGKVLEDAGNLLEELYQSGLDTVHDSTLEGLGDMAGRAEQYGLAGLSGLLKQLADGVAMRRHQLKKEADELAAVYAKACEYLYLCRGKVEIDKGWRYYGEG